MFGWDESRVMEGSVLGPDRSDYVESGYWIVVVGRRGGSMWAGHLREVGKQLAVNGIIQQLDYFHLCDEEERAELNLILHPALLLWRFLQLPVRRTETLQLLVPFHAPRWGDWVRRCCGRCTGRFAGRVTTGGS